MLDDNSNDKIVDNNSLNNMDVESSNINNDNSSEDVTTESLTVDYNNLYKLESDEHEEKVVVTDQDIQFDNKDYIQDESIIHNKEKAETKRNLIFMFFVLIILIIVILIVFPFIFRLKMK